MHKCFSKTVPWRFTTAPSTQFKKVTGFKGQKGGRSVQNKYVNNNTDILKFLRWLTMGINEMTRNVLNAPLCCLTKAQTHNGKQKQNIQLIIGFLFDGFTVFVFMYRSTVEIKQKQHSDKQKNKNNNLTSRQNKQFTGIKTNSK